MTAERLKGWFIVASAEYGTVVPILDDRTGPMEYGRDVLYVKARTKRRARVLFVRAMRRRGARGLWLHDGNPFRGMIVEDVNAA